MAQIPEFQHLRLDQAGLRPRAQPGIAGCSTAAVQDLGIQVQHQEHFPNPRVHPPAHSEIPQGYMSSIWSVNMVYQAQGRPEHRFTTSQVISLITRIDK